MQFTVPKFIEKKPKILGPLTFGQFLYIAGAIGICLLLFFILPYNLFLFSALLIIGVGVLLAFFKIGKDPLPVVIKNIIIFFFSPRIYIWKKKVPGLGKIEKHQGKTPAKQKIKNIKTLIETKKK